MQVRGLHRSDLGNTPQPEVRTVRGREPCCLQQIRDAIAVFPRICVFGAKVMAASQTVGGNGCSATFFFCGGNGCSETVIIHCLGCSLFVSIYDTNNSAVRDDNDDDLTLILFPFQLFCFVLFHACHRHLDSAASPVYLR